ncbi:MAG: hypothetical protein ACLT33_01245 [Lachnospira pectinoschiza]
MPITVIVLVWDMHLFTIKTEDDLIKYYKDGNHPKVGGTRYIYNQGQDRKA